MIVHGIVNVEPLCRHDGAGTWSSETLQRTSCMPRSLGLLAAGTTSFPGSDVFAEAMADIKLSATRFLVHMLPESRM